MPIGIVWPGFAVNTFFYAAILLLVIPGPFALRRFLRLRRGLCPRCAYRMGESAMCTECGQKLPQCVRAAMYEGSNVRRHFLTIAIFLGAGTVVNVAVAWGRAQWPPGTERMKWPEPVQVQRLTSVHGYLGHFLKQQHQAVEPNDFVNLCWALGITIRSVYDPLEEFEVGVALYGWPARSMGWGYLRYFKEPGDYVDWRPRLLAYPTTQNVMPTYPLWPGFAINTLFYATILWLLIPGAFGLRRFVRVRRGLCPKCAYPIGESAVCSECGRDLPKRVRPAT